MALISFATITISLAALFVAGRIYWETTTGARRRALRKQHGCLPAKSLFSNPLLLGIPRLMNNLKAFREHRLLADWADSLTTNNVTTVHDWVFGTTCFITSDPENVKTILATNFASWSIGKGRIDAMTSYLGSGVFTTEGAAWKHSRAMLRPCFERSQVADVSLMEKHDGTTVDLQPLLHQLTLDIATEFLFGRSTNALDRSTEDKKCAEFIEAFEYCQNPFRENENTSRWALLTQFLPDLTFKKKVKIIQGTLHTYQPPDFVDNIIQDQIAASASTSGPLSPSPDRYVLLDELLSQTQDRTVIRSELLNILLAGRDTTASLLSNLFFELPRHPAILARLRDEIAEHIGTDAAAVPSYEQLKSLKFLRAVINESQRLYPIVPSNSRMALHDTILPRGGGPDESAPVLVPKGGLVGYHLWSMHRRPDIYGADAAVFDPSRWLDDEHAAAPLRPGWAYLPFNGGPRVCIGQNFALTETMFVVVRLLQRFEIESRDDEPWREKLSLTCVGLGGCKIALRPVA
ncbi:cytochrome P450 alkane hydroxylase-like protein [Massariosphaeria phaeospora]|uniref:Cytochrome P450 alkane hydroxylase-like protein n=1 Tax=Massariosphaeria phaeospora TaxID=100035 RepID=A0A7C8M583_9PLEO|nr:cytochrome P450 alkane hydroxylase-like protein [Massariosphaeria phaeospora]